MWDNNTQDNTLQYKVRQYKDGIYKTRHVEARTGQGNNKAIQDNVRQDKTIS